MYLTRLSLLREEKDLKQKDLARILGVNRVNISNWENNKEIIPLDKLNICANYFNTSFDYLTSLSDVKNFEPTICKLDKKLIGNRILELRKKYNLTQNNLAHLLNTSHSTISAYENGKTLILTAFAYQICLTYNESMDWLCGRK